MSEKISFPIRINRYLALRGMATRREADELIKAGLVLIDGRRAALGDRIETKETEVRVLQDERAIPKQSLYIAYYKPRGVITHSPQHGERSIAEISGFPGTFPVGRLDKDSEGLIMLTNDGRITGRILDPAEEHEKEYLVEVREGVPQAVVKRLVSGVSSEGELLVAKKASIVGPKTLCIVLTQGKKHQIRRMLDRAHLTVERLIRIRIMGVHVGSLRPGQARVLEGAARAAFLKNLGLNQRMSQ